MVERCRVHFLLSLFSTGAFCCTAAAMGSDAPMAGVGDVVSEAEGEEDMEEHPLQTQNLTVSGACHLLWNGAGGCPAIKDKDACLSSRDGRTYERLGDIRIEGQPCVWCGGGQCGASKNLCEPYDFVTHTQGIAQATNHFDVADCVLGRLPSPELETPPAIRDVSWKEFRTGGQPDIGQACRGRHITDKGEGKGYYKYTASSLEQCKAFCSAIQNCTGIEYQESNGYCEVWSDLILWTFAKPGFQCFRVQAEATAPAAATQTATDATAASLGCSTILKKEAPHGATVLMVESNEGFNEGDTVEIRGAGNSEIVTVSGSGVAGQWREVKDAVNVGQQLRYPFPVGSALTCVVNTTTTTVTNTATTTILSIASPVLGSGSSDPFTRPSWLWIVLALLVGACLLCLLCFLLCWCVRGDDRDEKKRKPSQVRQSRAVEPLKDGELGAGRPPRHSYTSFSSPCSPSPSLPEDSTMTDQSRSIFDDEFDRIDTNRDGRIDRSEFLQAFPNGVMPMPQTLMNSLRSVQLIPMSPAGSGSMQAGPMPMPPLAHPGQLSFVQPSSPVGMVLVSPTSQSRMAPSVVPVVYTSSFAPLATSP